MCGDKKGCRTDMFRKYKNLLFNKSKKHTIAATIITWTLTIIVVASGITGTMVGTSLLFNRNNDIKPATANSSKPSKKSNPDALDKSNGTGKDGVPATPTEDETLADLKSKQIYASFDVISEAIFDNGNVGTSGAWAVKNAANNNVIMQAILTVNGETIGITPELKPGQYSDTISLKSTLPVGQYHGVAYVRSYKTDGSDDFLGKQAFAVIVFIN
jgi:hypothetical protein